MKHLMLKENILYDGTQLSSGWVNKVSHLAGDAIIAFKGKANVPIENMVDLEDVRLNQPIYSKNMLHFIVEIMDGDLEKMVLRQRLLMAIMGDLLATHQVKVCRKGDDLFDGPYKLSVSIATSSPSSVLIHAGINILSKGTPVPTKGLNDYQIDPTFFAEDVMKLFCRELSSIYFACQKVRSVS